MYNFRSSVLIHLKYSPDITHRKVFKWVQFYGRRFQYSPGRNKKYARN